MRYLTTPLLLATLGLASPASHAQVVSQITEQDQVAFNELYREPLATALRTRSSEDDLQLASEMMQFASEIPDDPGVQVLIYVQAISLSASGSDLNTMIDAAQRLERLWPGHREAAPQALLVRAEQAYRVALRGDRPPIAEPYLDLLLGQVAQAQAAEDYQEALTFCRQANTIARSVDSPRRPLIEEILDRLSESYAVVNRIEMLTLSVQRNPQNRPAAVELVNLLVVKRDDPQAASEFAELTQDPDTIELLAICSRGISQAQPPEAMRVGDWYLGLAEDENDAIAEPLLRRARAWYASFLTQYTRRDTLANRVRSMDQVAEGRLDRIRQARNDVEETDWTNLIAEHFDPEVHWLGRNDTELEFEDGVISFDQGNIFIPPSPQRDYELRVRATVNDVEDDRAAMIIYLPIGPDHAATVRYAPAGRRPAVIEGADRRRNRDRDEEEPINRVGQETELLIQVAILSPQEAAIVILIDDELAVRWEGEIEELEVNENHFPPQELGHIFRFTCPSNITFNRIELREHE